MVRWFGFRLVLLLRGVHELCYTTLTTNGQLCPL
jgi:hypothetical protein